MSTLSATFSLEPSNQVLQTFILEETDLVRELPNLLTSMIKAGPVRCPLKVDSSGRFALDLTVQQIAALCAIYLPYGPGHRSPK